MNYSESELTGLIKFDEARRAVELAVASTKLKVSVIRLRP